MSNHSCGGGCCGGDSSHQHSPCSSCSCHNALPNSDTNPLHVEISPEEEIFLQKLAQCPFLPMVQYIVTSSKSHDLNNVALSPVFLETGKETLDEIKALGNILLDLEEKDIISIDFDTPLPGTNEDLFSQSDSFALLKETVDAGTSNPDFLFDTPTIEFGSVCLTPLGDLVVDQLDFL